MNQVLQSGPHPDADQLSAFAEHALPAHEQQQTLAHLSVCPNCRAIVYLAQIPELAAVAPPQLAAVRRPWFASWNLAIPAVFALAALVLVTVHLRRVGTGRQETAVNTPARMDQLASPPQQAAVAAPATPQPAQLKTAQKPLVAPMVKPEIALPESRPAPRLQPPMLALRPPEPNSINGSLAGQRAPAFSRAAAGMTATTTSADKAHQAISGAVFKSSEQAAAVSALPANSPATQPDTIRGADAARHELHSSATQYNSIAGTAQTNLNQAVQAAPPPPSASANETVAVTSAAPALDTENAALAQVVENQAYASLPLTSMKIKRQPSLPSHLPTVSTIANAHQQLAIDTAGSLYRSRDAGVTWQSISIQWTGRAVKLQLVPSADTRKLTSGSGSAGTLAKAKEVPIAPSQDGFELITDAGSLWTSTDGQIWKQK